jgi:hypothetical protein
MNQRTLLLGLSRLAFALAGASLVGACTAETTIEPAPFVATTGRVTLTWTINGTTDPFQCQQSSATSLYLTIFDAGGANVGSFVAACESFATTVDLYPGSYSGRAELRDAAGQPRTTSIDIIPFRVVSGTNLVIPVDFPSISFF